MGRLAEALSEALSLCRSLGISPFFGAVTLVGGKVYLTARGVDRLAFARRVSREIIDGPRVVTLGGEAMVLVVCRASLPSGRSETAVATVPLTDVSNAIMRCETKAKRRATLSLLGMKGEDP